MRTLIMLCGNRWFSCLFASLCFDLELSVSLTSPSCQCLAVPSVQKLWNKRTAGAKRRGAASL